MLTACEMRVVALSASVQNVFLLSRLLQRATMQRCACFDPVASLPAFCWQPLRIKPTSSSSTLLAIVLTSLFVVQGRSALPPSYGSCCSLFSSQQPNRTVLAPAHVRRCRLLQWSR